MCVETDKPRGSAFVQYEEKSSADAALADAYKYLDSLSSKESNSIEYVHLLTVFDSCQNEYYGEQHQAGWKSSYHSKSCG
jgi:hypothetical protein